MVENGKLTTTVVPKASLGAASGPTLVINLSHLVIGTDEHAKKILFNPSQKSKSWNTSAGSPLTFTWDESSRDSHIKFKITPGKSTSYYEKKIALTNICDNNAKKILEDYSTRNSLLHVIFMQNKYIAL